MIKSILLIGLIALATGKFLNPLGAVPQTVEYVNLTMLEGVWYQWSHEITLFYNGVYCSYYNFTNNNGELAFTYWYKDTDGETPYKSVTPAVTSMNTTSNAKYKVVYSTLNQLEYWFLFLDDDYQTALIGSPNYKYATIICREQIYNDTTFYALSDIAGALGYKNDSWRFPYQGRACYSPPSDTALEY